MVAIGQVQDNIVIRKKKGLILMMKKLTPFWDQAKRYTVLLESTYMTEEYLDELITKIVQALKAVQNHKSNEKITTSMKYLDKLKQVEQTYRDKETQELNDLYDQIQAL